MAEDSVTFRGLEGAIAGPEGGSERLMCPGVAILRKVDTMVGGTFKGWSG